jgi:hypothetical protein
MTFDPQKPVMTRDGRKARIICTDASGAKTIIALIKDSGGDEIPMRYYSDGRYFYDEQQSSSCLINVSETKSYWANVYPEALGSLQLHKENCSAMNGARERTSILEIRMCGGTHVETIQHEVEK